MAQIRNSVPKEKTSFLFGNMNDDHGIGMRAVMAANEVARYRGWVQATQRADKNRQKITVMTQKGT